MKEIDHLSKYLFRYRAFIGAVFFILLVIFANPVSSAIGHALVLIGIALRLWAAGYIGPDARKRRFHAEHIVQNGPYRLLHHPLYIGNFLMVLGVIIVYNPPLSLGILYLVLFVIMYTVISVGEQAFLKGRPVKQMAFRFGNLAGELSTLIVVFFVYLVWAFLILRI